MTNYRPEIDGLRALAVLPVILFHAGFKTFSGGFVGVDVFFVISGYLITSIILAEKQAGTFSIINFYERRARRILPALFLVMFVCLPFAWLWLIPADIKRFSQSLVAVSVFASNVLFYLTSGYFDIDTELKPLIHTWSLAVEEQYYVLFPVFLILTWMLGRGWIVTLLSITALISLGAAHWGSQTYPDFTFYLLPTRGWEILVGAFVAFYYSNHNIKKHKHFVEELGSLFGFALIIYSIICFNSLTPFPSLYTLAPTIGAALIIVFATHKTFVGKILGTKLLLGIGLVSYSAYLWHQPLFAFARQRCFANPSMYLMATLVVVSFILAFLSWKYVERPFRNKHRFSRKQVFLYSITCSTFFIGLGLVGQITHGFENYWLNNQSITTVKTFKLMEDAKKNSSIFIIQNRRDNGDCIFNVENLTSEVSSRLLKCNTKYGHGIAVLGDSHATNLFGSLFVENNNKLHFLIGVTKNGCHLPTKKIGCQYDEFLEFVQKNPKVFSNVIYEKAGSFMLRTDNEPEYHETFSKLSLSDKVVGVYPNKEVVLGVYDYLKRLSVYVPVTWFGPRVEPQINDRNILKLGCNYHYSLRPNQFEVFLNLDKTIAESLFVSKNITYISQIQAYKFEFPRDFMNCEFTYWIDGNHFSTFGEREFGSRFNLINHILNN